MKRVAIVLGAIGLAVGGAAVGYAAVGADPPGKVMTACLDRNGDLKDVALGSEPRRACGKHETEVTLGNGDITAVAAGTGLAGGGSSGPVALTIAGSYRLPQACSAGQAAAWNGTSWACAAFSTSPLAAGDSRCADGGVQILIGLSEPAFVCNGKPGTNGKDGKDGKDGTPGTGVGSAKSSNGLFTLTIGNNGIVLKGPRGSVVVDYSGVHTRSIGGPG